MLLHSSTGVMLYTDIDLVSVIMLHNDCSGFRSNCCSFSRFSNGRVKHYLFGVTWKKNTVKPLKCAPLENYADLTMMASGLD